MTEEMQFFIDTLARIVAYLAGVKDQSAEVP
jgi:hypothetical protein